MKVNLLQGYILAFILSQSLLRVERIVVPTRIGPKKKYNIIRSLWEFFLGQ